MDGRQPPLRPSAERTAAGSGRHEIDGPLLRPVCGGAGGVRRAVEHADRRTWADDTGVRSPVSHRVRGGLADGPNRGLLRACRVDGAASIIVAFVVGVRFIVGVCLGVGVEDTQCSRPSGARSAAVGLRLGVGGSAARGGQYPGGAVGSSPTPCTSRPQAVVSAEKVIRGVPTVDLGGTLIVTGSGFCHPAGGGSVVGIQIDDGTLLSTRTTVNADPSIWQVAEAGADGTFLVSIRLPEPSDTDPEFADGSHHLRLVTGSLRKGDAVRQVETDEFVVLAGSSAGTLPEPSASPDPPVPRNLVVANAGGVTGTRSGATVRVVAPDLEPGDWVFPYAIGSGPEAAPAAATGASWVQLDANRSAVFEMASVTKGAAAVTKVSLQARDGSVVGWARLSSTQSSQAASPPPQVVGDGSAGAPLEARRPRPLVLIAAGAPFLLGIGLLLDARRRRLRRIAAANHDFWA